MLPARWPGAAAELIEHLQLLSEMLSSTSNSDEASPSVLPRRRFNSRFLVAAGTGIEPATCAVAARRLGFASGRADSQTRIKSRLSFGIGLCLINQPKHPCRSRHAPPALRSRHCIVTLAPHYLKCQHEVASIGDPPPIPYGMPRERVLTRESRPVYTSRNLTV